MKTIKPKKIENYLAKQEVTQEVPKVNETELKCVVPGVLDDEHIQVDVEPLEVLRTTKSVKKKPAKRIIRKLYKGAHDTCIVTLPKEVIEVLKLNIGEYITFDIRYGKVEVRKVEGC